MGQKTQSRRQEDLREYYADTVLSKRCDLQDVLSRPSLSQNIGILLDEELTPKAAVQLAKALRTLATRVSISDLSLFLICKCTRTTAPIIAESLQSFRGLKNIALTLNPRPGLSSVFARSVVRSLQNHPSTGRPVPLTTLPREIRHKIIDLVFNSETHRLVHITSGQYSGTCGCCQRCVPPQAVRSRRCACFVAVGGFSSLCQCRTFRLALFRVNKSLYEDSTFVFFSTNRVCVDIKTMAKFCSNLPDDALKIMRMIEFYIPFEDWYHFSEGIPEDFATVVDIILSKCNLSRLHLSIHAGDGEQEIVSHWPEEASKLIASFRLNLVAGLKPLKDIGRLDVYLECALRGEEEEMERLVMGCGYNSFEKGKLSRSRRDFWNPHELDSDSSDESDGLYTSGEDDDSEI